MEPQSRSNDDQTQYWNGPEAGRWLVHEHRYERMLAPFTRLVLGAVAVARDADDGQALGVDISRPLLLRAEQRARQDGLSNLGFEHGDAQTYRLAPGGFDVAISRFGGHCPQPPMLTWLSWLPIDGQVRSP